MYLYPNTFKSSFMNSACPFSSIVALYSISSGLDFNASPRIAPYDATSSVESGSLLYFITSKLPIFGTFTIPSIVKVSVSSV